MSVTHALFERWKAAKKIDSNRAAMRLLGLSPTANIHWKAGRNADADVIERMALELGENPGALIAEAMAEQAKGEAARTWTRLAKQLGAAATVAAVTVALLPSIAGHTGDVGRNLYIMSIRLQASAPVATDGRTPQSSLWGVARLCANSGKVSAIGASSGRM